MQNFHLFSPRIRHWYPAFCQFAYTASCSILLFSSVASSISLSAVQNYVCRRQSYNSKGLHTLKHFVLYAYNSRLNYGETETLQQHEHQAIMQPIARILHLSSLVKQPICNFHILRYTCDNSTKPLLLRNPLYNNAQFTWAAANEELDLQTTVHTSKSVLASTECKTIRHNNP